MERGRNGSSVLEGLDFEVFTSAYCNLRQSIMDLVFRTEKNASRKMAHHISTSAIYLCSKMNVLDGNRVLLQSKSIQLFVETCNDINEAGHATKDREHV